MTDDKPAFEVPGQTSLIDSLAEPAAKGLARRGDPDTSKQSAAQLRVGGQRAALLSAFASVNWAITDRQARRISGLPATAGYWKRCSDLRTAGLIQVTGDPVLDEATGRKVNASKITQLGIDALEATGEPGAMPGECCVVCGGEVAKRSGSWDHVGPAAQANSGHLARVSVR